MSFDISRDNIFQFSLPAKSEELKNKIVVETLPLQLQESQEIYKSQDPIEVQGGVNKEVTISWVKKPDILCAKDVTISLRNADDTGSPSFTTVSVINEYSYGTDVILSATSTESVLIVANGKPFSEAGKERIEKQDSGSISEYGSRLFELKDNHLIQTVDQADEISDTLLASYKQYRKDVQITYRGNPALELRDVVRLAVFQRNGIVKYANFIINRQNWAMQNGLTCQLAARRTASDENEVIQIVDGADTAYQIVDGAEPYYQMR